MKTRKHVRVNGVSQKKDERMDETNRSGYILESRSWTRLELIILLGLHCVLELAIRQETIRLISA